MEPECKTGLTHESGSGPYTAAISLHTHPYLGKGWSGRRCRSHGYSVYKRETESGFVQEVPSYPGHIPVWVQD